MSDNVIMAIVAASASFLTAFTALLLNYRGFGVLEDRMKVMEADLKEFYKHLSRIDSDISRLKERSGMS